MKQAASRHLALSFSVLLSAFLTYLLVLSLSFLRTTTVPEVFLIRCALILTGFFLPILGAWYAFRLSGGLIFALLAGVLVILTLSVSHITLFLWVLFGYVGICLLLNRIDREFQNQIAVAAVDLEKFQNERNDLQTSYQIKGEGISVLFEKYSTYYNLRKLAEELATTLSLEVLAQIVVRGAVEFIPRGNLAVLKMSLAEGEDLEVLATHRLLTQPLPYPVAYGKGADQFDLWVI